MSSPEEESTVVESTFAIAEEEAKIADLENELSKRREQFSANMQARIASLEAENTQYASELEDCKQQLATAEQQRRQHQKRLAEREIAHKAAVEHHAKQVQELQCLLAEAEAQLRTSEAEKHRLEVELGRRLEVAEKKMVEQDVVKKQVLVQAAEIKKLQETKARLEAEGPASSKQIWLQDAEDSQNPQASWPERICQLVRESPQTVYITTLWDHWNRKWPKDDMGKFQPVKKLKKAVQDYVAGVRVDEDLKIVLVSTADDRQGRSRSRPELSLRRSRSRSRRRAILDAPPGKWHG
eukprot:gnl/TRDRNA2_/TRDRNA2_148369_c0_seq1.p1 gnl/TRDRNA2_/TRDRNA2_148369_c0~~gnl/TRDRNA2_/TRDRNA2_148369_c0_seq1.p1  ORF type:complete len:296 (-),score=64.20 gnl/TRDRNA2_/TRDRNA2_148369_c0_seq1:397-1284(-)